MTRADLIARLAERHPDLIGRDAETVVKLIIAHMIESLTMGDRIELRDFGTFELRSYRSKLVHNPQRAKLVQLPAHHVPFFKAGKLLRERVNGTKLPAGESSTSE